jgi:hypothetical protein
VKQCLTLPRATQQIAGFAILLDLPNVAANSLPAFDLPSVFLRQAAAHVIAAIPLEPPAWIVAMDPALSPPFQQRLTGIDPEKIE